MLRTRLDSALDYRNITIVLVALGLLLVVVSIIIEIRLLTPSLVILLASLSLNLTIAIRTEKLAYISEFSRSWADVVMEQTNNLLLIGGLVVFIFGLVTTSFFFGIWLGIMYIAIVSLSMWFSARIARRFVVGNRKVKN